MLQEVRARATSALQETGLAETVGTRAGWLHTAEGQMLQTLWNEFNFQATKQRIKNIFYRPISPTNTTCAGQRGHCAGKEKLRKQQSEPDSETRATCALDSNLNKSQVTLSKLIAVSSNDF